MMVAVGFLGLDVPPSSMPPALLTLHRWLDSWPGNRGDRARDGSTRVRPRPHEICQRGMAGDLPRVGEGTLIHEHHRIGAGEESLAGRPMCGMGDFDEDGEAVSGLR